MRTTNKDNSLSPIVKWVGGKRQILKELLPLLPAKISTYVEPFVGGGALLFELQPKSAIISDFNEELINVYLTIKDSAYELIECLERHEINNTANYFYQIRGLDRNESYSSLTNVERAARIIYLNKTCYNGLYRVNQAGQFNTPYGKYKSPNIVNKTAILAMSNYFNNNTIEIINSDYRNVLKSLKSSSFVYLDPPYMPLSKSSSFTSYTNNGFSTEDQIQLKKECDKLNDKGINFILSNSDHPFLRELYSSYKILTVQAKRSINSIASKRGEIREILIMNNFSH